MRLKAVLADERGYVYAWCGLYIPSTEQMDGVEAEVWREADRVYVMNREWKTCFYEEILDVSGVQVLCFQIGPEGAPFFLLKDQTEICVQEIDVDSRQARERVSLGSAFDCFDMEDANFPEHMAYTGSGWAYCKNGALLEFWQDTQEKTQILNLASAGLLSEDILFLAKSEDGIEIICRDTENLEYIVFAQGVSDKKTVTLGVAFSAQDLERAVAAFNRDSAGEEVDAVRKLVEEAENRFEYHPEIQNIINEEAQGYLSGQVDLDRTEDPEPGKPAVAGNTVGKSILRIHCP